MHHQCRQALFFLLPSCPSKANILACLKQNLQRALTNASANGVFGCPSFPLSPHRAQAAHSPRVTFATVPKFTANKQRNPTIHKHRKLPPYHFTPPCLVFNTELASPTARPRLLTPCSVDHQAIPAERRGGKQENTNPAFARLSDRDEDWILLPPVPRLTSAPCASLCG